LRAVLAAIVLVASWLPALASIALAWIFALPELPVPGAFLSASPPLVQSRFDDIGVTIAVIYGALAATLVARRAHPVTGILVVHALGSALAAFGVQWGLLGVEHPGLPALGLLLHAAGWAYVPGTIATTIVPLLVLGGPPRRSHRVLVAAGIALAVIGTAAALVHQAPGMPPNPLAIPDPGVQALLPVIYGVVVTVAVALSIVVAGLVVARLLAETGVARRRLAWLAVGHGFLTLSYGALILPASVPVPDPVWEFGMVAPVIGQIFYPSAVLVLVLGPRLRGVDERVVAVLEATILAVAAATGYIALTGVLMGAGLPGTPAGVAAAAAIALALVPGRDRLRRGVERLVWGDDGAPAQLVRRLSERVGELEPGGSGLAELVHALRDAARLGWVELRSADGRAAVSSGRRAAAPIVLRLRAAGVPAGELVVAPRAGGPLRRATRRQLAGLAPILAVALRLAEVNAELADARDEVSEARHGERRTLRRELHDGVGPALAGIGFGLAAVDRQLDTDPAGAVDLAGRLAEDLDVRVREVQALVRAIGPHEPEHDLAADLRELARDFAGAGLEFVLDVDSAARVAPGARRTLSLIASEAVHNAARHAGASRVRLAVLVEADTVTLEIVDDGAGFDPVSATRAGVGLASMRERMSMLDGTLELDSTPGRGTTVRASFTSRSPADRRATHPEVSA